MGERGEGVMIEAQIIDMLDNFETCVMGDPALDANMKTHLHHIYLMLLQLHCPKTLEQSACRLDALLGESAPEC